MNLLFTEAWYNSYISLLYLFKYKIYFVHLSFLTISLKIIKINS